MKGIALCWIVLCHIDEKIAGDEYIANPTVPWPPLAERIRQLQPVNGHGIFSIPLTILRDLGWFGDQGVTLFLMLSGFGLTWGLLTRGAPKTLDARAFFKRRFARMYPTWWGAHLLFLPIGFFMESGLSTRDPCFYTDILGLRFFPRCFYYFSPAWWYFGLLVQLYAVYPILWRVLRSKGPQVFLACACAVGFTAIACGPVLFHDAYLDAWQRGAFFVTRLPEFALGMAAASWRFSNPMRWDDIVLRNPVTKVVALIGYAAGTWLSLFLLGMIVAPVMLGAAAFVLLHPLCARFGGLAFIGRNSYALYLTHDVFVELLVRPGKTPALQFLGIVLALLASICAAWLLERGVTYMRTESARRYERAGKRGVVAYAGWIALIVFGLPLAAEAAVRSLDPQEVLGWGERPSLRPDARFGWTLIPGQTTHLRWESYDYRVTANEWGFPAPAFSQYKPKNALRVLVTGDAYSSAEGVDTNEAWPRILQDDLARDLPDRSVQVANFAITGYGPNQEAAVVLAFAPRLRPDIVLIEMFVNDVDDVLTPDDTFRRSIGFGLPSPNGVRAFFGQEQLRRYLSLRVIEPLLARLRRRPDSEGYFLGNFAYLERGHAQLDEAGVTKTAQRYTQIVRAAAAVHARVLVVSVPAPVQVCDRSALVYYPNFVDLHDARRYDFFLPQRRAARIASESGVPILDMRQALRRLPQCPYQPRNMHFTVAGNAAAAAFAARALEASLSKP